MKKDSQPQDLVKVIVVSLRLYSDGSKYYHQLSDGEFEYPKEADKIAACMRTDTVGKPMLFVVPKVKFSVKIM